MHEGTESPEDGQVWWFASLNNGGKNSAVNGGIQFLRLGPDEELKKDTSAIAISKKVEGCTGASNTNGSLDQ